MRPLRIAFTGLAGAGKNTAADRLVRNHDYREFAFADTIKSVVHTVFGVSPLEPKDEIIPRLGVAPRRLYQVVGTEMFRDTLRAQLPELTPGCATVWISALARRVAELPARCPVVVTDCRYGDEVDWLRANHFVLVRVVRPGQVRASMHTSEDGCDTDIVLYNHSTIADLHARLDTLWC